MNRRTKRAFTLVELLVVIAIIGVLIALLLPAIQAAREAARRSQCQSQLKQIGLAVQMHHDANGVFPEGRNGTDPMSVAWSFLLLPYLEQQAVYDAHDPNERVDAPENSRAMRTPIDVYACPSRRPPAADRNFDNDDQRPLVFGVATLGDYAANAGDDTDMGMDDDGVDFTDAGPIFTRSQISGRQVTDGLSQTFAIGERHIPPEEADEPDFMQHFEQGDTCFLAGDHQKTIFAETDIARGPDDGSDDEFGSMHSGVTQFVYLDGHVTAISNEIDEEILEAMGTIQGGEIVPEQ